MIDEPNAAVPPAAGGGGPPVVALVIAGAAARGAYEAGVLAELLPALDAQGLRPTILLGTSSGAINAVLGTMYADRPAEATGRAVAEVWAGLDESQVFAPLPRTGVTTGLRYVWGGSARTAG